MTEPQRPQRSPRAQRKIFVVFVFFVVHMLVRSCCFSAWRSSASAMRRSSSCEYSRPLAAHIFEYMLMVVKPGIVFTSFRYKTPLSPASRKSTRAMPAPSSAFRAIDGAGMARVVLLLDCARGVMYLNKVHRIP